MKTKANKEIRYAAERAGVRLWQIADELSLNDGNFSRKLRKELPAQERDKILQIIAELSTESDKENLTTDLKACPFCGNEQINAKPHRPTNGAAYYTVQCPSCGCSKSKVYKTIGTAIKDWNSRC